MTIMESDLKPCPFCGGAAEPVTKQYTADDADEEGWTQTQFFVVTCGGCGAEAGGQEPGHKTEADAAAAWNRRASGLH